MPTYSIIQGSDTFPVHIVDASGMPHVELTLYAQKSLSFYSRKTSLTYLRELVAFASWAVSDQVVLRQGWSMMGNCAEVQTLITHFLTSQLECIVVLKQDKQGFESRYIEPGWGVKKRNLSHLLAALASFYRGLHQLGFYGPENPMRDSNANGVIKMQRQTALELFTRKHGRAPMPAVSGIDNFRYERSSACYFKLGESEWVPAVIDDPSLRNRVLTAGESWGWTSRELGLVCILFDSGCRIHEACTLTIGDWQNSNFGREIRAVNKGSKGLRSKTLYLSDRTVKILHKYLYEERCLLGKDKCTFDSLRSLPPKIAYATPLFITSQGSPLSPDYFRRRFWTPALMAKGVKLRPHQVRHWFVTMAIQEIMETAKNKEEIESSRLTLRLLMSWRTDMLPVYDQALRHLQLPQLAAHLHAAIDRKQFESSSIISGKEVFSDRESEASCMLKEMLAII